MLDVEKVFFKDFLTFFLSSFQNVRRRRPAVRAEEVDPLLRGRDCHHLLRGAVRLRPGPGRGRGDEPDDGEHEALRLHLQQQMVRRHVHHLVPQQEGSLRRENQTEPAHRLLSRIQG